MPQRKSMPCKTQIYSRIETTAHDSFKIKNRSYNKADLQDTLGEVPVVFFSDLGSVRRPLEHWRVIVDILHVYHNCCVVLLQIVGRRQPQLVLSCESKITLCNVYWKWRNRAIYCHIIYQITILIHSYYYIENNFRVDFNTNWNLSKIS